MKLLENMTWKEAKEAFAGGKVAVIPTGSIEQHGPHMPLGTDYQIADFLAKELSKKADVIVTPAIPVGFAPYHQDFSGTLTIDEEVLSDYYLSIANSLVLHGATHILFINGHGGNMPALNRVCKVLRDRGITAAHSEWWFITSGKGWPVLGHGDIVETSMMMVLNGENVQLDQANVPVNKNLTENIKILDGSACEFDGGLVNFYLRTGDVTDTGDMLEIGHAPGADYTISPADSTVELGEEILTVVVDYLAKFVVEFKKIQFEKVD